MNSETFILLLSCTGSEAEEVLADRPPHYRESGPDYLSSQGHFFVGSSFVLQRWFWTCVLLWEWHDSSQQKSIDLSLVWLFKRIYTLCFHV